MAEPLKYIDLFAGLGGFHIALQQLGCECVYVSELREDLRHLYASNFNYPYESINDDITKITDHMDQVPPHDILCGGFPCQPFSKAGKRQGFNDKEGRGNLFNYICDILNARHPKYVLLENVSNLVGHDNGNTWKVIQQRLDEANYWVKGKILSPHEFGIPQHRKRIYIIGVRKDLASKESLQFPDVPHTATCDIRTILDSNPTTFTPLKPETKREIEVWQEFVQKCVEHTGDIPKFPVWAMEFGADYEYESVAPAYQTVDQLIGKHGDRGALIAGRPRTNITDYLKLLPPYARNAKTVKFPQWKINFIRQNREFYQQNKTWIDEWLPNIQNWPNCHIKLEWNCTKKDGISIYDKIIQYRPSGIRVKKPTFSPALTYMGSQIPILPFANGGRYLTIKEAARLQGMQDLDFSLLSECRAFEALGNAVNVDIVKLVLEKLLKI